MENTIIFFKITSKKHNINKTKEVKHFYAENYETLIEDVNR